MTCWTPRLAGVHVDGNGRVLVDEYQRTTAAGIFALGDVSSQYQLKHVANHEARVVRHNLLQDWDDTDSMMPSDHRYVPSAVFTDPQIASVGLTENQARAKGYHLKVKVQDYSDVAYGWAMEDTTGFAKIIVDEDTGLILGAHLMGHQASSLIQPIVQAMSFGLPATGHGPRSVLDSPGAAGGDRERDAGAVRRATVAAVPTSLTPHLFPRRGQSKKPCSSDPDPAMCARIAASALSGSPARIAMTIASCCSLECAMLRNSNGIRSKNRFTRIRFSATSGTRDGEPTSAAIARCSRESSRR